MTVTNYFLPGSVAEALDLLAARGPELLVMAGGTVAMPLINEGISLPRQVMGLRRAGLDGITRTADGGLRIGATTTLTQLLEQDAVPVLREAAARTASWSIRNMGTVGGNLFTPPPGGDVAVALLALDASTVVAGPDGERTIPLADFFTGFMTTALRPGDLVTAIVVPAVRGEAAFVKLGRKHANTPSVVTVAAHVTSDAGTGSEAGTGGGGGAVTRARIALGAAGPHPWRATRAEAAVEGTHLEPATIEEAAAAAAEDCEAFTDAIASDWYRRRMAGVIVRRTLERLATPAGGGA